MIKNIIFDVGMVLVDFRWEEVLRELGLTGDAFEAVANATVHSPNWNEYDRSSISQEELLGRMLAAAPGYEREVRLFWEHNGDTIWQFPYAIPWVKSFKDKGYGCYILSNYAARTYELTKEELSFESLMDGVIFSYRVGQVKPEPDIYHTLLRTYHLLPEECVFMDDNPANIAVARDLGMYGIVFTNQEEAIRELRRLGVDC